MSRTLDGSVELLDRALGYTRARLAGVRPDLLGRPTPCEAWTLADLLAHLEDGLDAFTEAAGGAVEVRGGSLAAGLVPAIQDKAWGGGGAGRGRAPGGGGRGGGAPGGARPPRGGGAGAALEVSVHGWDVGQSTGDRAPLPADLAQDLLPVAHRLVGPSDRGARFAAARPARAMAPYDLRLLAFLGRS